jgi:hypothetical protein
LLNLCPEGNFAIVGRSPDPLSILGHTVFKHFCDGEASPLASFMVAYSVQVERSYAAKDLIASSTLGSWHEHFLLCCSMRT